jgi:benzodiazapine receptor
MSTTTAREWPVWTVSIAAAAALAALGRELTPLGTWYYALAKPPWQPPDWLFGPAWTLIFACTAAAAALGWQAMSGTTARVKLTIALLANAALNVTWSLFFFRWQRPDWALAEVVALWLSIVVLIVLLRPWSRTASWLLAPYLGWVTFAAVLNFAIVRLNAPFETA